ncbi:2-hydroxyacyl-CoA dehydratase subunit D [Chloroflexota bacterium]
MSEGMARVEQIYLDRGQRAKELKAEGKKVIGYFCTLVPAELITAAGCVPYRLSASMKEPITEAHSYLETIACPFTRSALDLALKGKYSFIDGYVIPHACDNIVKLYDLWTHNVEHSYAHFLNVPHTLSQPSMEFFEAELNTLRVSLERYTENDISMEDIRHAIQLHNEQRALVRRLYEFRKKDPPYISGVETTKVLMAAMSLPVEEANELLQSVVAEVANRNDGQGKPGPRLMIYGTGNEETAFIEVVEETGANVVADDLCFGTRPYWFEVETHGNPLAGLARSYLEKINCPRTYRQSPGSHQEDLENRFGYIHQLAKDFTAKGVIFFILRYCDTHCFDAPDVKQYLEGKGIPVLEIEEEYPISGVARLKTRIEAFLEMLG